MNSRLLNAILLLLMLDLYRAEHLSSSDTTQVFDIFENETTVSTKIINESATVLISELLNTTTTSNLQINSTALIIYDTTTVQTSILSFISTSWMAPWLWISLLSLILIMVIIVVVALVFYRRRPNPYTQFIENFGFQDHEGDNTILELEPTAMPDDEWTQQISLR